MTKKEAARARREKPVDEDARLIDAALEKRARRTAAFRFKPLDRHMPYADPVDVLHYVKIVEGVGTPIRKAFNLTYPFAQFTMGPYRPVAHAKHAVAELLTWCRDGKHPQLVEAFSVHHAADFMRKLFRRGLTVKTIKNYRAVYAKIWDHVAEREAEFIAQQNAKRSKGTRVARAMENPWRQREFCPAVIKKQMDKRPQRQLRGRYKVGKPSDASRANLAKGPEIIKRKAARRAKARYLDTLTKIIAQGINTNSGIAEEMKRRGVFGPKGGILDATRVRRLRKQVNL